MNAVHDIPSQTLEGDFRRSVCRELSRGMTEGVLVLFLPSWGPEILISVSPEGDEAALIVRSARTSLWAFHMSGPERRVWEQLSQGVLPLKCWQARRELTQDDRAAFQLLLCLDAARPTKKDGLVFDGCGILFGVRSDFWLFAGHSFDEECRLYCRKLIIFASQRIADQDAESLLAALMLWFADKVAS